MTRPLTCIFKDFNLGHCYGVGTNLWQVCMNSFSFVSLLLLELFVGMTISQE